MKNVSKIISLFIIGLLSFAQARADSGESAADLSSVKKVGVILVSSTGLGQSTFGHIAVRLQRGDDWGVRDWVLEFAADTRGEPLNPMRGLGLGTPYKLRVDLVPYEEYSNNSTKIADRDLTTYELRLSESQTTHLLKEFERLLDSRFLDNYLFVTRNCATFVGQSINKIVDARLSGQQLTFPKALIEGLESKKLVTRKIEDDRASVDRAEIIESFERFDLLRNLEGLKNKLPWFLSRVNVTKRHFGYVVLANVYKNNSNPEERKALKRLAQKLILTESLAKQTELLNLFGASLESVRPLSGNGLKVRGLNRMGRQRLIKNGDAIAVETMVITLESMGSSRSAPAVFHRKKLMHIDGLRVERGTSFVKSNEFTVGLAFQTELSDEQVLLPNHRFVTETIGESLFAYQYTLASDEIAAKIFNTKLPSVDTYPQWPFSNLEAGGLCLAMARYMDLLYRRGLYDPELPALASAEEYAQLFAAIGEGAIVIFPGVAGPKELFEKIGRDLILARLQKKNAEWNGLGERIAMKFDTIALQDGSASDLLALSKVGIAPLGIFEFGGNQTHALNLFKISDSQQLTSFDPNFGVQDFTLDRGVIRSPFYAGAKAIKLLPVSVASRLRERAVIMKFVKDPNFATDLTNRNQRTVFFAHEFGLNPI